MSSPNKDSDSFANPASAASLIPMSKIVTAAAVENPTAVNPVTIAPATEPMNVMTAVGII
jgi:hypothetical protein